MSGASTLDAVGTPSKSYEKDKKAAEKVSSYAECLERLFARHTADGCCMPDAQTSGGDESDSDDSGSASGSAVDSDDESGGGSDGGEDSAKRKTTPKKLSMRSPASSVSQKESGASRNRQNQEFRRGVLQGVVWSQWLPF